MSSILKLVCKAINLMIKQLCYDDNLSPTDGNVMIIHSGEHIV